VRGYITSSFERNQESPRAALGADFVVDSNDGNLAADVRKITEKARRGMSVVEHIAGDVFPKVFECSARAGTVGDLWRHGGDAMSDYFMGLSSEATTA